MSSTTAGPFRPHEDPRVLRRAAIAAFVVEAVVLTTFGWQQHWLAHPQPKDDQTKFIEAQIFEPKQVHLMEEKPVPAQPHHETVLSKVPNQGKKPEPQQTPIDEQNQTESGPKLAPTHGPVAVFAPPPKIPPYLQNEDLKASVVIDFLVSSQGQTEPKLVGSSGNQELDAIAIATAKRWQFRPAEKDHHPIDSKVRLRIVFEVHD